MGEDSKLGSKIKAQTTRFAGRLTQGMGQVTRRWVCEMLYGIQGSSGHGGHTTYFPFDAFGFHLCFPR